MAFKKEFIEVLPIPDFDDTKKRYVGVSVMNKRLDAIQVDAIESIIRYLVSFGHRVHELYSQNEFVEGNIEILCNWFFTSDRH